MTSDGGNGETLGAYLATHDLPCHHCGYNLRGCTQPICPECGTVIARPVGRGVQQAMRCLCCGHPLGLAPLERCPACGSDEIYLGVREAPIRPHPLGFGGMRLPAFRSWKGVPRVLWVTGALSLIAGVTFIAQNFNSLVGALSMPLLLIRPLLAAAGILAPAVAAALWYCFRRTLNSAHADVRRRLVLAVAVGAVTIAGISWLAWI